MRFEQDPAAVVDRRPPARGWRRRRAARRRGRGPGRRRCRAPPAADAGSAGSGCESRRRGRRRFRRASRPSLAPWMTWPLMLYGRPSRASACFMSPAASAARTAELETRMPVHLVAHHPGDVEAARARRRRRASRSRRRAGRRSGSRRRPARSRRRGPSTSTRSMKASGDCAAKRGVEAQDHHLLDAAALELAELVAQRRDPCRRRLGLAGEARRSSRADSARSSSPSAAGRGAPPRRRAAPASPGGRGARRRNCRSSAPRRAPGPDGGRPRKTRIAAIIGRARAFAALRSEPRPSRRRVQVRPGAGSKKRAVALADDHRADVAAVEQVVDAAEAAQLEGADPRQVAEVARRRSRSPRRRRCWRR